MEILKEYARYLDKQGIKYNNHQGFSVHFNLDNVGFTAIDVIESYNGQYSVYDYIGEANVGKRAANKLVKELSAAFPDYKIFIEQYTVFEIEIQQYFDFTTIENLHQRVLSMADAINRGYKIAKDMLGESFYR